MRIRYTLLTVRAALLALCMPTAVLAGQVEDAIRNVLEATQPDMQVEAIAPSPIPGLYEVTTANLQTIYASEDANFFIPGDMYEVVPEGLVNRGELRRNEDRLKLVNTVPEDEMIIFEADGERQATLTVFTDVDCPYCRKLHDDIDQLNAMGIAVRYLAFPRRGPSGETYEKMVSTWCSDTPQAMLTSAKRGGNIPGADCDNPVARHYELGATVGVRGTPALVLEDGYMINGYAEPDVLAQYLLGE